MIVLDGAKIIPGMGEPPVLVSEHSYCSDCHQHHEFERCPKCGAWIHIGYLDWESKNPGAIYGFYHTVQLSDGRIGYIEKSDHFTLEAK